MPSDLYRGFQLGWGIDQSRRQRLSQEEEAKMREELEKELLQLRKDDLSQRTSTSEQELALRKQEIAERIRASKAQDYRANYRMAQDGLDREHNIWKDMMNDQGQVTVSYKGDGGENVSFRGTASQLQNNLGSLMGQLPKEQPATAQEPFAEVEIPNQDGTGTAKLRVPMSQLGEFGFMLNPGEEARTPEKNAMTDRLSELQQEILKHEVELNSGDKKFGFLNLRDREKNLTALKTEAANLIKLAYEQGRMTRDEAKRKLQELGAGSE